MIDLSLNKNKIKEIKYEVKEGKTVIFKFRNFDIEDVDVVLDDVDVIEDNNKCCNKKCNCHTTKTVYDGNAVDKIYATDKQIIDEHIEAENKKIKHRFDALALDKSRELMNKIKDVPYKVIEKVGTLYTFNNGVAKYETEEDQYITNDERETKKQKKACGVITEESEAKFSVKDLDKYGPAKHLDDYEPFSCLKGEKGMQEALESSRKKEWEEDIKNHEINPNNYKIVSLDEKYKDASKEEKEEVSREIIQKDAKIDTDIIKERNKDRTKDEYYKGDPNDEYSKIKSFGDVDVEKTEFVDFLKDEPVISKNAKEFLTKNGMKYIGQMKIDRKTDEIIDYKPNDNNKNDE